MAKRKLGQASVNIGANLKPLQEGIGRAKTMLSRGIRSMGMSAVRGIGRLFSRMFDTIVRSAKYATAAIVGMFAASIWAADKQERAEIRLAAALQARDEYTHKGMQSLKDYASELQRVSEVGDEATLANMQLASSLGVSIDRLPWAARGVVGLSRALNMSTEAVSRYIALAEQGEFTMLNRYLPALRTTNDEKEKMAILDEAINRGMEIAEAEIYTFSGALRQARNSVGDLMERFGTPFLNTFTRVSHAIRDWADTNGDLLQEWGERAAESMNYVIAVIGQLFGLAKQGRWDVIHQYLQGVFERMINGLKSWMQSVWPHAEQIGIVIGRGIASGIKEAGKAAAGGMSTGQKYGAAMAGGGLIGAKVGGPAGAAVGAGVGAVGVGAMGTYKEGTEARKAMFMLVEALRENNRLQKMARQRGVQL